MKLSIGLSVFAALNFANPGVVAAVAIAAGNTPPALHAQSDPADSTWRAARRAIADEEWDRAISAFQRLRARYEKSPYYDDSYYWQAFALYQKGGQASLREAVNLLETQRAGHASAATVKSGEARQLTTRIRGVLAQNGDEASAAAITRAAGAATRASAAVARGGRATTRASASSGCPDEDSDDRMAALNALLQMNSADALPLLKQVLARRDTCSETLRRKAVFLVSQKRSSEAADILVAAAKDDPDPETREQAVFWLGQVDTERSVTLLEQILKSSNDENLQDKALFALSQGRDSRGAGVLRDYAMREDAPVHLREQAIFWLGQRKSDENGQFLRELFAKTKNAEIQDKIIFSISQTRSAGNDQFLLDQAVNKANSMDIRKQALFWAGQTGSIDASRLGDLYDKGGDVEFREQVIFVLSQRSRDGGAIDKLIAIAKTEKDRDLRQKAIFWLGQSRDPKALKALADLILKNPE